MGPRLCSRGDKERIMTRYEYEHASMGPRLCSRGDERKSRPAPRKIKFASMGPRLCSRGDHGTAHDGTVAHMGFNGAAAL